MAAGVYFCVPAKAGTSGGEKHCSAWAPEVPAFAGMQVLIETKP